jgi:hypothetical protein
MNVDIFILMIISFILGFMVCKQLNLKIDHLVNLDDTRKIELSKCCTNKECYNKPPHLRDNCEENKAAAFAELEKRFKEMYTQEEYYNKLKELNLIKDTSNFDRDVKYMNEFNEKILLGMDKATFDNVRLDDRDEVIGNLHGVYAGYNQMVNKPNKC